MAKESAQPSLEGTVHEPLARSDRPHKRIPRVLSTRVEKRPRGDHAAEAVLDKLNRGIVIFDQDARVRFLNDAAMRLIHQTDAICILDGRLVFTDASSHARLLAFLRSGRGRGGNEGPSGHHATVMRVEAGADRAPYRVLLSALRTPVAAATGGPSYSFLGPSDSSCSSSPCECTSHFTNTWCRCVFAVLTEMCSCCAALSSDSPSNSSSARAASASLRP
jgi:hypothetical protein